MVLNSISNKSKVTLTFLLLSLFLISSSLAVYAVGAATWKGNVTIGTNTSTDGAVIGAYISNVAQPNTTRTVGQQGVPSSGYAITPGCSDGETVFLKVWGIINSTLANFTCSTASTSYSNLSVSLVASGASCTYSSACSNTNYVCCSGTSEINDGTTTGATCKSTCAAAAAVDTGGSGGGGGGGGGGGSAAASETSSAVTVSGSKRTSIPFTKASTIAVSNIALSTTATAAITNGKITVRDTTVSNSVSSAIAKGNTKVYKYLSLTKVNIQSSDIEKATVKFEVPYSWINANSIDKDSIKLNRYINDQWVALPTKRVAAVNSRAYSYEAETPDFSTFAISGEKITKLTAFQLIDIIREFYAGTSSYTAFDIIDLIRNFYA